MLLRYACPSLCYGFVKGLGGARTGDKGLGYVPIARCAKASQRPVLKASVRLCVVQLGLR
jgi:hypothetical protein